jgi:anti-sigma regulatory factor (Ser/Thr protein kinase)
VAAEQGVGARVEDVGLAVHEAAANSVRHGGGGGLLRTWSEGGSLVFEVRNPGRVRDPMVGRVLPPVDGACGRGLWLMNQVCDLVQVRNAPHGVVVRLHFRAAP